jgi:hypothetical protein
VATPPTIRPRGGSNGVTNLFDKPPIINTRKPAFKPPSPNVTGGPNGVLPSNVNKGAQTKVFGSKPTFNQSSTFKAVSPAKPLHAIGKAKPAPQPAAQRPLRAIGKLKRPPPSNIINYGGSGNSKFKQPN